MISRMLVLRPPGVFRRQNDNLGAPFGSLGQGVLHIAGRRRSDRAIDRDGQGKTLFSSAAPGRIETTSATRTVAANKGRL